MSYDIRILVKVEGLDKYAIVGRPDYDDPTYNLGDMFRACTGWDFKQHEPYRVSDVMKKINHGIEELVNHPIKYRKYNDPDGWGKVSDALEALQSLRECIHNTVDWQDIPIEHLYVRW